MQDLKGSHPPPVFRPRPGGIPLRAFIRPTLKGMGQRRIRRRNSGKGHHPCARTPKRLGRWNPAGKAHTSVQRLCGATSRPYDGIPPPPEGVISYCRDEASPRDPPRWGGPEISFPLSRHRGVSWRSFRAATFEPYRYCVQNPYQTFILDTHQGFP